MPKPKGLLRHKWLGGTRSSCQRPGCTWSRDRGYVPARYFQTDPKHPSYFGGGTPEAPVCEGRLPGQLPPGDFIVETGPTLAAFGNGAEASCYPGCKDPDNCAAAVTNQARGED